MNKNYHSESVDLGVMKDYSMFPKAPGAPLSGSLVISRTLVRGWALTLLPCRGVVSIFYSHNQLDHKTYTLMYSDLCWLVWLHFGHWTLLPITHSAIGLTREHHGRHDYTEPVK